MSELSSGSNSYSSPSTLFTRKRMAYTFFGAFAFVGGAAAINAVSGSNSLTVQTPHLTVQKAVTQVQTSSSSTPSEDSNTTNSTSAPVAKKASSHVQVTVNGQNIPVPTEGNSQQTVTNDDGGATTVTTSASGQGSANNTNVATLNVTVTNSSTGSSTTP